MQKNENCKTKKQIITELSQSLEKDNKIEYDMNDISWLWRECAKCGNWEYVSEGYGRYLCKNCNGSEK